MTFTAINDNGSRLINYAATVDCEGEVSTRFQRALTFEITRPVERDISLGAGLTPLEINAITCPALVRAGHAPSLPIES
jgi:hypothetical protein